jgi:hypothetical protein
VIRTGRLPRKIVLVNAIKVKTATITATDAAIILKSKKQIYEKTRAGASDLIIEDDDQIIELTNLTPVPDHPILKNRDDPGCVGSKAVWDHIIEAEPLQPVGVGSLFNIGKNIGARQIPKVH